MTFTNRGSQSPPRIASISITAADVSPEHLAGTPINVIIPAVGQELREREKSIANQHQGLDTALQEELAESGSLIPDIGRRGLQFALSELVSNLKDSRRYGGPKFDCIRDGAIGLGIFVISTVATAGCLFGYVLPSIHSAGTLPVDNFFGKLGVLLGAGISLGAVIFCLKESDLRKGFLLPFTLYESFRSWLHGSHTIRELLTVATREVIALEERPDPAQARALLSLLNPNQRLEVGLLSLAERTKLSALHARIVLTLPDQERYAAIKDSQREYGKETRGDIALMEILLRTPQATEILITPPGESDSRLYFLLSSVSEVVNKHYRATPCALSIAHQLLEVKNSCPLENQRWILETVLQITAHWQGEYLTALEHLRTVCGELGVPFARLKYLQGKES